MDLGSILSGNKHGVAIRFARKSLADMCVAEHPTLHARLSNHVDIAEQCKDFAELDLTSCNIEDMKRRLTWLIEAKVDFPTDSKYKLFDRWSRELCEATADMSGERMSRLLEMVTPWPTESNPEAIFDPLSPHLGAMEGSATDKAKVFTSTVVDKVMSRMVMLGGDGKAALLSCCKQCLDHFADLPIDVDDYFLTVMSEVLSIWRALVALLTPDECHHVEEVIALQNARDVRRPKTLTERFAQVLKRIPEYMALLDDFVKTSDFTSKASAQVTPMLAALGSDEAPSMEWLHSSINDFATMRGQLRRGLSASLEDKLIDQIEARKDSFDEWAKAQAVDEISASALSNSAGEANAFLQFFVCVSKAFEHSRVSVAAEVARATTLARQLGALHKANEFAKQFGCVTLEWLERAAVEDLQRLAGLKFEGASASEKHKHLEGVGESLVMFILSKPSGSTLRAKALEVATAVMNTSFLTFGHELTKQLEALQLMAICSTCMAEWELLGRSDEERIGADPAGIKLRSMRAALVQSKEAYEKCSGAMAGFKTELDKSEHVVVRAAKAKGALALRELAAEVSKLCESMGETLSVEKNWKKSMKPNPDWKHLQATAQKTLLALEQGDVRVSEMCQRVKKAWDAALAIESSYEIELAREALHEAEASWIAGMVGVWEAKFLLGIEKFHADQVKLRKFAVLMQKELWVEIQHVIHSPIGMQPSPPHYSSIEHRCVSIASWAARAEGHRGLAWGLLAWVWVLWVGGLGGVENLCGGALSAQS